MVVLRQVLTLTVIFSSALSRPATSRPLVPSPQQLVDCINESWMSLNATHATETDVGGVQAYDAWWSEKERPRAMAVTVVTHLSVSRLPQLWAQCRSWRGPLSAAVYASVRSRHQLQVAAHHTHAVFWEAEHDPRACVLDVVLVFDITAQPAHPRPPSSDDYPVNVLRNVARLQARTELAAMVDVDMVTGHGLGPWLMVPGNAAELLRLARDRHVFVLPAFQAVGNFSGGAGGQGGDTERLALRADDYAARPKHAIPGGLRNGSLAVFASVRYARGHRATNFSRWLLASEPYEVQYERGFEPWVIAHRRAAPWADARFRGYGMNKVAYVAHLNATNHRFVVHPQGFLVHRAHEPSHSRTTYVAARVAFLKRKNERHVRGAPAARADVDNATNSWHKVMRLYASVKEEMDGGRYTTVIDPATRRCREQLVWWQ